MFQSFKNKLEELWQGDHLDEFFDLLKLNLKQNTEICDNSTTLLGILNSLERENQKGNLTTNEYFAKRNKLRNDSRDLLLKELLADDLLDSSNIEYPAFTISQVSESIVAPYTDISHHQYTCDRSKPFSTFKRAERGAESNLQFFYFHGMETQYHLGLFRRVVDYLKGIKSFFGEGDVVINPVKSFEIVVDFAIDDLDELDFELREEILTKLLLSDEQKKKIGNKCLSDAFLASPICQTNSSEKYCFYININGLLWDKEHLPMAALEFINNFCVRNFPESLGEVYFFFSIDYSPKNTKIKDEIEVALENAQFLQALGELEFVKEQDIEKWFIVMEKGLEMTTEKRDEYRAIYFPEQSDEMHMEKIQPKLLEFITDLLNPEKNMSRK